MITQQVNPITLTIPSFGDCTLFPLSFLPASRRTYQNLLELSVLFDLTELPEISRNNIQEIFKAIAHKLSENELKITTGITIWISGVHDAYSLLNIADKDQDPEKCITFMDIFLWDEITVTKKGVSGGTIDMTLEEMKVGEQWELEGDDLVYCLFMGT